MVEVFSQKALLIRIMREYLKKHGNLRAVYENFASNLSSSTQRRMQYSRKFIQKYGKAAAIFESTAQGLIDDRVRR